MLDTIEETLRQLRMAMDDHRRSLAADSGSATLVSEPRQSGPRHPEPRPGERLVGICAELERVAGVQTYGAVAAKLDRLFAETDATALAAWVRRIRRDPGVHPDLQLLIESLTTHETYFFRDRPQLDVLRTEMLPPLIAAARADGSRRLRLWSAGCATGEEAYSLAVVALAALFDAGEAIAANGRVTALPGWRVEVLGTDISGRALETATAGLYGTGRLSSFRDVPSDLLGHFPLAGDGGSRRVSDDLRRMVRFARFNLLESLPPIAGCDVVACRNVLIYLTPGAAKRVQEALHRALRPGGCLLLGPTDSIADAGLYESHWRGTAFVHRRRAPS
jgi:chemotaxis protein methyltransferase CheR